MKKVLSFLLTMVVMVSLLAFAGAEEAPATVIDFEDGNISFLGLDMTAGNADASNLSVVDYNGSKALMIDVQAKVPYVAFNLDGLLGENIVNVRSITFDVGVDLAPNGKFYAVAGSVLRYVGEENNKLDTGWSVYMKKKNPKTATIVIKDEEAFMAGVGNTIVITKSADTYTEEPKFKNEKPLNIYIDNIRFLDAEGNPIAVDTTAVWSAGNAGPDLSNIYAVTGAVDFAGFSKAAGAWSQDGLEMPQEIIDALVPGSVVEISYASETGDIWIVMPDSAAGWMRVGDGNNGKALINGSKNIAQIPYELIAQYCGEDKTTWGARMQCEASGAWEVFSVKVGKANEVPVVTGAVDFAGFTLEGGAWGQNGIEMTEEIINALVPGSVVEISYESESGNMWIVMPDSAAGWMRVADGGQSLCLNGKCYITYEQIAEKCGEDKTTWGARMQCESDSAWAVYAVKVGTLKTMKPLSNLVDFAGFTKSAGAWSQDGLEMTQEIIDALVPGSVVSISYESETGNLWIVMPDSAAGWMRVADGGQSAVNGSVCQITYEQIAEKCGEDKTTWGARMQCESDSAWTVYSVAVGKAQ